MYFEKPGNINTKETVRLAVEAARERNIKYIVVASNSGSTAKLLSEAKDINVICVAHVNGFKEPGKEEMPENVKKELESIGVKVLVTTHVLSGAERGLSKAFGGVSPVEVMAYSLRMMGQGTKVGVEISVMALDAGLIPYGERIIAVGGTGMGADTAIVITPSHAGTILETKINEIICKPSLY